MSWEDEGKYRFRGQFECQGDQKLLLFQLDEPVVTKVEEQIVVPDEPEEEEAEENTEETEAAATEEIVIRETVRVYPQSWTSFGEPVSVLQRRHYAGDWDVLRPAKELEEMNIFTAEKLDSLMKEAEAIMEGWKKTA